MNIGKSIRKIRTENNMSQEEFAEIFFVTRQTVSNWENEKSYPDLNTIVKISDEFGISLDTLLKGDREMINEISEKAAIGLKWNKLKRIVFITLSIILICMLLSIAVYGTVWAVRKNRLEKHFGQAIADLGFVESDERYYILENNGVTYTLPHQEMPSFWDFSTDFHAKFLDCCYENNSYTFSIRISGEYSSLTVTDENGKDYYSGTDGAKLPESVRREYSPEKAENILKEAKKIYNQVY
ncbi:MAG: helix-turn-helix domain-containing protein [Ruminococcus sp.]|nr:helix-turn-helix domain-containing protein [Ruminococcus sp.]